MDCVTLLYVLNRILEEANIVSTSFVISVTPIGEHFHWCIRPYTRSVISQVDAMGFANRGGGLSKGPQTAVHGKRCPSPA